ncbi:MAG: type II secretion system F family protein [Desulfofustis sp. PB-SRB1]|jgi:type IV pilus assembly protein PilC|nr:type II secretion system F family protein [Desulfofustis sp. PB-SRB1]HBH29133.1 type II secretion system F family protein [Desulfofustis sp.]
MPVYVWRGKNQYGEKRKGEVEAATPEAAATAVKRLRISEAKIKEKPKDLLENVSFLQKKVTQKDIVVFTRQLATMISAGLALVQCIEILAKQQDNPTFKKVLIQIQTDVESGTTFADSMRKHPKAFDTLYCNMIEAGETAGILDTILNRLATYIEKAQALKRKVKGAMTYPVIVIGISIVILGVILVFVIPVFESMFADMDATLPAPTQLVVSMSDFVKNNIVIAIPILGILIFLFSRIYKTEKGRAKIDQFALQLPLIGSLLRKVAVAKFCRTLGTLLQSGVPILESLQVVARTAGNMVIERAVLRSAESIAEGRPLAEPLDESGVFPNLVVQMIDVGESVGALDAMLAKISDFYDEEVDQAVENLTAAIEPLMIVGLGGMIGGIIVAMYLPIFQMAGNI